MNDDVKHSVELFKDYGLMPYSSAYAYCYSRLHHFDQRFFPNYKKHFAPFRDAKRRTLYHIGNIKEILKDNFTFATMNQMGIRDSLAILRIVVAGLTDQQVDSFIGLDITTMTPLLKEYEFNRYDLDDLPSVRYMFSHDFDISQKGLAKFDIDIDNYLNPNILIFTIKSL